MTEIKKEILKRLFYTIDFDLHFTTLLGTKVENTILGFVFFSKAANNQVTQDRL